MAAQASQGTITSLTLEDFSAYWLTHVAYQSPLLSALSAVPLCASTVCVGGTDTPDNFQNTHEPSERR